MSGGVCKTLLRTDDPAAADDFGTHQRLADVLSETISDEEGGRAIALVGPFGSGKSTIVYLLKLALSGKKDEETQTKVFTYDAWTHQGDPLRRSFLEELRNFLVENVEWLRADDLKAEFESLEKRRQETETRSVPDITWQGGCVLASFLLIPLGIPLLPTHLWGYVLAVAPAVVWVLLWTLNAIWPDQSKSSGNKFASVLELLWKRNREITRSMAISSPEPTSLEFQRLFEATMGKALARTSRRLVIVMDNLDRLFPKDALQIVSTMRTFFIDCNPNRSWGSRLWLLVPFSPSWPSRLWTAEDGGTDARSMSASFLEKSFQIQLHVSEQLLSNWKAFLLTQLRETMPDHSADDFQKVYLLYSSLTEGNREHLTPRAIKNFVNKIGMSHREWQHHIPLATMAAYALLSQEAVQKWIDAAGSSELLKQTEISLVGDENWVINFSALYFNAPPEEAAQALMADRVRAALTSGDAAALEGLAQIRGHDAVCEKIIVDDRWAWASQSPVMLILAAAALKSVTEPSPDSQTWNALRFASETVSSWPLTNIASGRGMAALVESYPQNEQQSKFRELLKKIHAPQITNKPDDLQLAQIKGWLEGLSEALRFGKEALRFEPSDFVVGTTAEQYVDIIESARQLGRPDPVLLRPQPKPKEVVGRILELLRSEKTKGALDTLRHLVRVKVEWPLEDIVSGLVQDFTTPPGLSEPRTSIAVSALLFLGFEAKVKGADDQIKQLVLSGRYFDQVSSMIGSSAIMASSLYLYMMFGPSPQPIGNSENSLVRLRQVLDNPAGPNNIAIVEALKAIIIRCGGLLNHIARWQGDGANSKVLGSLITSQLSTNGYTLSSLGIPLVANYDFLKGCLSPEIFNLLMIGVIEDPVLDVEIVNAGFSLSKIELYRAVLAAKRENPTLSRFLMDSTAELTAAAWTEQLTASGPAVELVLLLVDRGQNGWLRQPFQDALIEHSKSVIENKTFPEVMSPRWGDLTKALEPNELVLLLRYVRDEIVDSDVVKENIFKLYGRPLCDSGVLQDAAEAEPVVRKLFKILCLQKMAWGIDWVADAIKLGPEILSNAGSEAVSDFVDRVRTLKAEDGLEEGAKKALDQLWSLLVDQNVASDIVPEPVSDPSQPEPDRTESA